MPQLQSVVLKDRQATPVNHTFVPRDIENKVGTTVESSGVPLGDKQLSVSMVKTPSGRYNATIRGSFPVIQNQVVNGITTPTVVRVARAEFKFSFDASSTTEERNDIVGMMQSALDPGKVLVNDAVVKLEGVY